MIDLNMSQNAKSTIESGKAILGIEFGSTRIKAVLIDQDNKPIAQGSHEWENQLVDGLWTYSIEAIWNGLDLRIDSYDATERRMCCTIAQRDRAVVEISHYATTYVVAVAYYG